jgi:hypothetical protein
VGEFFILSASTDSKFGGVVVYQKSKQQFYI